MQSADFIFESIAQGKISEWALIDVRSPGEFIEGHFPGFVNLPVLNDEERAVVGLTYKEKGQKLAIEKGHELVHPTREERVFAWKKIIASSPSGQGLVTCWRGGLRSKISAQWLQELGVKVDRIEGGYKMLRRRVLQRLEEHPFHLIVLSGLTGSGKTRLLNRFHGTKVDLEDLAHHRGSAFGHDLFRPQPSQATFENRISVSMIDFHKTYVVEDESRKIGQLILPSRLKTAIMRSPVVVLETNLDDRVKLIYDGYILDPILKGKPAPEVRSHFVKNLNRILKPLGGDLHSRILKSLNQAFESDTKDFDSHREWISLLLTEHYDRRYHFAFSRLERRVIFKGDYQGCLEFLQSELRKTS